MQRSRIMATNVSFFNDEAVWRKLAIGISNLRKLEEFALIAHESDKPDVSAYQNILTSSTNVANLKSVNLMLSKDTVSQIQKILRESELKTLTLNFHEGGENYETMVETLAGALQNTKKLSRVLFYIPFDSSDAVYEILFRHLMPNTLRMLDISYSKTSSPPGSLKFFEFNGTFNSPESKLQITIPTTNGVITQSLNVFRKPASWLKIHVNVDVNDLKTIFNSINPDKLIDIFIICNKFINLNVLR
ncbi:hypothetical protein HK098_005101 [Nowakowskiella sp. JEL0407]|nr:hypothetical protein HK098_005101 [Nowakowskiella sp. JEL0407]